MTSWVELDPPPGWDVEAPWKASMEGTWVAESRTDVAYAKSREAVCRKAWERWALEVIDGRAEWDFDPGQDGMRPMLWYRLGQVGLVTASEGRRFVVVNDTDDYHETACGDPVEALARLAGMMLASCGPATTDGTSVAEGGES